MSAPLIRYLDENAEGLFRTLAELHSMPEPGNKELRTAAYLAQALEGFGYEVKTGVGGTGVVGVLKGGQHGPVVGLRADMDALVFDVDGAKVANHACGHDANSTEVLWAAAALAQTGAVRRGELRIVFQPAEELADGALSIIRSGALEGLQYFFSTHLRSIHELPLGKITPSLRHAASGMMSAAIKGKGAHGARPHLGVNAAEAAAAVVFAVNSVHVNPIVPHSAKVTMIKCGGNAFNIIPDLAEMVLDVRAQTNEVMADLRSRLQAAIEHGAAVCGAEAECLWRTGCPAAQDDEEAVDIARRAITRVLGDEGLAPPMETPGGEDFHYYAQHIPGLKTTVIGIGADLVPGLHVRDMTFAEEAVMHGAKVLALMAGELTE
ncbi:MAG: amidohydrolase [Synergistaceae bacterium]|jgi:amidohydrolase|nr:amidohydrolase [Synergistaceae bacterium]